MSVEDDDEGRGRQNASHFFVSFTFTTFNPRPFLITDTTFDDDSDDHFPTHFSFSTFGFRSSLATAAS